MPQFRLSIQRLGQGVPLSYPFRTRSEMVADMRTLTGDKRSPFIGEMIPQVWDDSVKGWLKDNQAMQEFLSPNDRERTLLCQHAIEALTTVTKLSGPLPDAEKEHLSNLMESLYQACDLHSLEPIGIGG